MFRCDLESICSSEQHPHVMRILVEECVERIEDLFDRLGIGLNSDTLQPLPYWPRYLSGIKSGVLLESDYSRYLAAKKLADLFLKESYLPNNIQISDYKRERYSYALSKQPLPKWFAQDCVSGWIEEIITAYCFLWFSVMDYAYEMYCEKGA